MVLQNGALDILELLHLPGQEILQKLYRYSNLKTTIGYQANFIHDETDDTLDMILNSLN